MKIKKNIIKIYKVNKFTNCILLKLILNLQKKTKFFFNIFKDII
jgi:hypothetical protein